MRRFYVPKENIAKGQVKFSGEESHHIRHVLRLGAGETVEVFDGSGKEYLCRIRGTEPEVQAEIIQEIDSRAESPARIILAQALVKFDKFDYIVQKTTELGICEIWPVISDRTDIRVDAYKARSRQTRWQKIAVEAAKQSHRALVPKIYPIRTLETFLAGDMQYHRRLKPMLTERQGESFKEILTRTSYSEISLLVGPEGGWSEHDLLAASSAGYLFATLGRRILRAETAGLIATAIIQYQLGDLS